ncbi:MAG: hypothetical protein ABI851_10600 [Saprospiraceae bacterium]
MGQLSFQYPEYYIILCLLLGVGGAFLLYFKSKSLADRPEWQRFLLAVLRGLSLFFLGLLLMNPVFKRYISDLKKPQLAIAIDQSVSMIHKDSTWVNEFNNNLENTISKLSDKYQLSKYYFGATSSEKAISYNQSKRTNIDDVLTNISDKADPQLLKAVILFSDGIYNNGKNPYYNDLIQNTPFYSIFHGDSTQDKDLLIQRVYHNDIIYSGDKFSIQLDLQAWQCNNNQINLKLERLENNIWKTIYNSTEQINSNTYFSNKEIINDESAAGIYKYRAVCSSIDGERNTRNNSRSFFIEVLDARKKVLIYALGPHPDISAIKNALESNKNYQVDIKFATQNIEKLETYNLVIFHQLPSNTVSISPIINKLNTYKTARLFILGSSSNLNEFNIDQDIIKIISSGSNTNEAQSIVNAVFNNFTLSETLQKNLRIYPPLNTPFGNYETDPTASILLYQRIGQIDTKYPLFLFNDRNGIKTSVLCGDGIWKWKFQENIQSNNFDAFFELITKSVQYVSSKEDRRKFRVSANKNILNETEDLIFNAELYNDNYEQINIPDVSLILKSSEGKSYDFNLGKKDKYYELNIGTFPAGEYTYIAKTEWNNKSLQASGKFSIQEDDIEISNLVARPDLLRGLAEKSNGKFFYKNQLDELSNLLNNEEQNKPILFQTLDIRQIIERKWILFIILLLLSAEWFLRRFWGSY